MKAAGWLVVAMVVTSMALQGCAGGAGVVQYAPGAEPGSSAQAAAASAPVVTAIYDESSFQAVRAAVDQQMKPGGRYSSTAASERAKVNGRFDDMAALFSRFGTFDKMDQAAKSRINDDQNAINAVLAARDGNRLICHNEMPIGSHLPKRVCRTLSEIQNQKTQTDQMMRAIQSKGTNNPNIGG
jgi:hypothetical protein